MSACPHCSGKGFLEVRSKAAGGQWVHQACPECLGTGKIPLKRRIVKKARSKC